jgi:SAM-dependent methyltransferase
MANWQKEYFDKYYRQLPGWQDLQIQWHELIRENVSRNARVLEVGPGLSNDTSEYLSDISGCLIGLDIDPDVKRNRWLDEACIYDGNNFPFPDNCFDAVVSRWVNEHVEKPAIHCKEIHRILVPNGKYIFRTPNLYHYTAMGARITPHWFHVLVANWLRNKRSGSHDPYPTYYRLNTRKRIRKCLSALGFKIEVLAVKETYPVYGQALKVMFYVFMAYERIVNSTPFLEDLRYTIDGVANKVIRSD